MVHYADGVTCEAQTSRSLRGKEEHGSLDATLP